MTDIPPKQPVSGIASARVESAYGLPPLPHADRPPDIDATGALVSIHNAATQSGPDSFPVLKAFQEYLESERRSARRRVALISGLFAGIIVIVVAIFLTAGILLFDYMKDIQDNLWRKIESQPSPPSAVAAVVPAPAPAAAKAGAWDAEMKKLGEAMAELKRDNEKLRATLAAPTPALAPKPASAPVAVRPPVPAPKPAVQPSSPVVARPAPTPAAAAAMPRPSSLEVPAGVVPPPPPEGFAESGVYLQPEGKGAPIPWRVLVPTR